MAPCPACGHRIGTTWLRCPFCGDFQPFKVGRKKWVLVLVLLVVLALLGASIYLLANMDTVAPDLTR